MSYEYAAKKRSTPAERHTEPARQPSLDALRSGAARPTQEQLGHRVDLPDAMREKMETAFGADLSGVRLYESQTVADAGANAITQGSNIAFAPGMLDFTSFGGQALLGHEISHVVSQSRGEVTGRGFLNDHALEARADREGAMAAAGQQIAMPAAALSSASAAPAAGPMQAGKNERRRRQANEYRQKEMEAYDQSVITDDPQEKARLEAEYAQNRDLKVGRLKKLKMTPEEIEADNAGTTSATAQAKRAGIRHLSPLRSGGEAPNWETKKTHYDAYLGNLGKIMGSLKDDELKAQPDFQKHLVNEYASVHRALYGPGSRHDRDFKEHETGSFLPGDGPDLLGTMYGRLMGKENIQSSLAAPTVDKSIEGLNEKAKESGVADLMANQYAKLPGNRSRVDFEYDKNYNSIRSTGALRDLLTKVVAPAAGNSPAAGRIGELEQELARREAPPPAPEPEPDPVEQMVKCMEEVRKIQNTPINLPPGPSKPAMLVKKAVDRVENTVASIQSDRKEKKHQEDLKKQLEQQAKEAERQRELEKVDFNTRLEYAKKHGLGKDPIGSKSGSFFSRLFRRKK